MERMRAARDRVRTFCAKIQCQRCSCSRVCCLEFLRQNVFVLILSFSVVLGIILGIALMQRPQKWTKREIAYLKYPGELYLRMLELLILPLIASSIISAIAGLDAKVSGKISARALLYYLSTTIIAVVMGIILVVAIQPGKRFNRTLDRKTQTRVVSSINSFLDLLRNILPDNIVEACFRTTSSRNVDVVVFPNASEDNVTTPPSQTNFSGLVIETQNRANFLGVLTFSFAFGIAVSRLGDQTRVVQEFFIGMNAAILTLVRLVIKFTPIGIIFLIAAKILDAEDLVQMLSHLGLYAATVIVGLLIHTFIVLPSIFLVIVRKNPFKFMLGMLDALLCALSTASSSATLPLTIRCAVDNNEVDPRIGRLVLPVGAVVNMDGTALYEAVAAIFISEVNGRVLDFGSIIIVSLTSTLAAIGAAGIPEGGLVTMLIVLEAIGLPASESSLILSIDWFLDRLRTTTNVWGDAVGAAVIEKLSASDLARMTYMNRGPPGVDNVAFKDPDFENDAAREEESSHGGPPSDVVLNLEEVIMADGGVESDEENAPSEASVPV